MRQKGFTLIEVMIVVVIVGILASIAYPSYTEYVLKSDRAEAKAHLLSAMQAQERHYSQSMTYLDTVAKLTAFSGVAASSEHNKYTLSIDKCTGSTDTKSCVVMLATPQRTDTNCGVLSIDSRGVKAATGTKGAGYCW